MRRRSLGIDRETGNLGGMNRSRLTAWLLAGCLLLTLGACGTKGPLELPEEERQKKSRSSSAY